MIRNRLRCKAGACGGWFRAVAIAVPWVVALAWAGRTIETLVNIRKVPDLLRDPEPLPLAAEASGSPVLSVIVPACNEEGAIEGTVRSLLASRGVPLEVIAVDDRSLDRTPQLLDRLAQEFGERLRVVHIQELPPGWLGKPHALAVGTRMARGCFLLFTDADVRYRGDALARALALMRRDRLDHLTVTLTLETRTPGERMMISAIHALSVWGTRLWKIGDPEAKESLGVGSFGLVRREAIMAVGGWERLRMEVLEDLRLGYEIKRRLGLRQGIAFGRDLLHLRWGSGVWGLAGNMTKNGFALFRYSLFKAAVGLAGMSIMILAPVAALAGPPSARPALLVYATSLVALQTGTRKQTGLPLAYALTFPAGAMLFVYALARSVVLTLCRGGVEWRGTRYPLAELRHNAGPLR